MFFPTLIIFLLLQVGVIATFCLVYQKTNLNLSDTNLISHIIQIWACVGTFISATIIIHTYILTSKTFVLSQKPSLYIMVANPKVKRSEANNELVHMTQINYRNMSNNPFYDLSLSVKVSVDATVVDLSDLFRPRMFMAATDSRLRNFVTEDELKKRGIDFISVVNNKSKVLLSLGYSFTFNSKKESINVQEYIWDAKSMEWSIF